MSSPVSAQGSSAPQGNAISEQAARRAWNAGTSSQPPASSDGPSGAPRFDSNGGFVGPQNGPPPGFGDGTGWQNTTVSFGNGMFGPNPNYRENPASQSPATPQSSGLPAGIDMAQFGGGGAQHINNRNPSQTGMPATPPASGGFPAGIDMAQFGGGGAALYTGTGSNGKPNPPPPSISGTINGQTFMSGGMAPKPAGPSLMGYPDAKPNPMPIDAPRPSSSPMGMQIPTARMAGQTFETGGANTPQFSNPSPTPQPAPAMATQGAAPVRAMESGMPSAPANAQSYMPQPMPQGMSPVPTNQVYQGVGGIKTYTAPNGQRKPANYYPSLNQYGVMS
jgi:hypothetical protein